MCTVSCVLWKGHDIPYLPMEQRPDDPLGVPTTNHQTTCMKELIETLYPMNATLLGVDYDNRLEYLKMLLPMKILEVPSGTQFGTWTVPKEWVVREAWVKYRGKKILDFATSPLSLMTYSAPFSGKLTLEELKDHLRTPAHAEQAEMVPYNFSFYEPDWAFCLPKTDFDKLKKGTYEVYIDSEFRPGTMKIGIHTIKGTSDREILLFAHLDHPYQANDNLSGVACLVGLVKKLKCEHTVKLVFCPETIGSQAYVHLEDLSKVDFMLAIDICGNDNSLLVQQSWNHEERFNRVVHCALQGIGKQYRKGRFRTSIGSDEYAFNDPLIGIPGCLISTWPYLEYHTDRDTPEKINYERIEATQELILKIIEVYEKDYVPVRLSKGPLMRSRYGLQSSLKQVNLNLDYLWYDIDGEKPLTEICARAEIDFDTVYNLLEKLVDDHAVRKSYISQINK